MAIFEKNINISTVDFSLQGQLRPEIILKNFQVIATDHVAAFGIGQYDLIKKGLLWVVTQTRVSYLRPFTGEQAVCLRTWSLPPRHGMAQREYQMLDDSGNILVVGASQWVLMDMATRKATLQMTEVLQGFEFESISNYEKRPRFLRPFPVNDEGICITPGDDAIDFNNHVNNSCYADYMIQALPDNLPPIKTFTIDYRKEMRLGESLQVHTQKTETGYRAAGFSSADKALTFLGDITLDDQKE